MKDSYSRINDSRIHLKQISWSSEIRCKADLFLVEYLPKPQLLIPGAGDHLASVLLPGQVKNSTFVAHDTLEFGYFTFWTVFPEVYLVQAVAVGCDQLVADWRVEQVADL